MSSRSRGQMVPRGTNKWLIRVYLGTGPDGSRRYSSKTVEGTTSQARKELTAMLRELDTQSFVEPSKMGLREYLGVPAKLEEPATGWLRSKIDITPRTQVDYRRRLELYVVPALGHRKLHEIDAHAVQSLISSMADAALSPRTIEYTYRVLHAALEDAVKQNLLVRNPSDNVKLPKKVKRAPSILTMKQVGLFLEATSQDALHALWMLLLTSGLRPQEALALMWSDVDLDGRWLSVCRVLVDDGHGKTSIVERTKTDEAGMRRIGLPESAIEALRTHKTRQNAEILLAGPRYERLGLVFANSLGRPLDHNLVRRRWKTALKAASLPRVRLYDTRHSHLTALLANGADIAWVSARAGHKDIKMTRDHYAHVMPETHREMGEMTERMLQKANGTHT